MEKSSVLFNTFVNFWEIYNYMDTLALLFRPPSLPSFGGSFIFVLSLTQRCSSVPLFFFFKKQNQINILIQSQGECQRLYQRFRKLEEAYVLNN